MRNKQSLVLALIFVVGILTATAQVNVDVNLDIKHSVNGVSDFGRERHITLHSSLVESDWEGEEAKAQYLLNDLDVYLGRDNGSATWKFQYSAEDPDRPNHHDPDSLRLFADWWLGEYESTLTNNNTKRFENRSKGMICGTNPHPTYPTLSYWYMCGSEWGRNNGYDWLPQDIETSAEWMVDYLDHFFVNSLAEEGELMPEYWEVINEPDMKMNTGAFMITSWEDIWEYHNLVAEGIKQRLGANAPKIGGMTWGLHDLAGDDLNRSRNVGYSDAYYGTGPENDAAKAYARQQTESAYLNQTGPWTQWDVLWKGFMNTAGDNMDFYSVHLYDWPTYNATGGTNRTGGHVEGLLDLVEWYDVSKNGFNNRKPIILSEYGAVQGAWDYTAHDKRYDWEVLKPFSAMLMQFLERPDYIVKSMPFTPVKATWGDTDSNGDGVPEYRYQYTMMRDDDMDGNWEWSDYIKWFELWAEVEGTRVDTKSSDPDIQVDCYIDGNDMFLILNNLEDEITSINLNMFGSGLTPQSVRIKQLYLSGTSTVVLDDNTQNTAPSSIQLQADATMILKYTYGSNVSINHTSIEKKFFGEAVSNNERVTIAAGDNTFYVNGVTVPSNPSQAEAMLRMTVNLYDDDDDKVGGFLTFDKLTVNGTAIEAPIDWRGTRQNRSRYFGTLEIPIPASVLQTNNTIVADFHHSGEASVVNIVTWDFSKAPGRTGSGSNSAPIVNAGADQNLAEGTTSATLSGTGSDPDGDAITYSWTKVSGPAATISNSSSASTSVSGLSNGNNYVFRLSVSDGALTSYDDVAITVNSSANNAPVANAGNNQSLVAGTTTAGLSGSGTDADGDALTYSWSKVSGPAATISNGTSANASVSGLTNGSTYVFRLTVSDGSLSDTDDVQISVANNGNTDVIVMEAETFTNTNGTYNDGNVPLGVNNAGTNINWVNSGDYADYSISVGQAGEYKIEYQISTPMNNAQIQIAFDGTTASTDNVVNNGQWDSYQTLVAGSNVNLSAGSHDVRITASGSNAWQWNLDKVTLTLQGTTPNTAPVANAGSDQVVNSGITSVNLSGSGSDAEGDALTYSWTQVSGSNVTISNSNNANASVSGLSNGNVYVFRLTVSDGSLTDTDDVQITVNSSSNNPGPVITIEAESFTSTNGTYNDGNVPLGANKTANNINWVNNGDYMDYPVNGLEEGSYEIVYYISSPITGSTISFSVDGGTALNTTTVPNNGQWDTYQALTVSETVNILAGNHTIRLTAGAQTWTWNLDKFTIQKVGALKSAEKIDMVEPLSINMYPNPANNVLNIKLTSKTNDEVNFAIYNTTGRLLKSDYIKNGFHQLSLDNMSSGLYIIQIRNGNEIVTNRFIKE